MNPKFKIGDILVITNEFTVEYEVIKVLKDSYQLFGLGNNFLVDKNEVEDICFLKEVAESSLYKVLNEFK